MRLRSSTLLVAAATSLALVASSRAHAGVTIEGAPCRFSARAAAGFSLYGDALSEALLARTGAVYDVTLDGLSADLLGTHVHVQGTSVVKGAPPVRLDAFTDLASFELRTAHDVTIVPDHVWVRRDQVVDALGGALGRMQISTSDRDWPAVFADVPCSDVSMQRVVPDPLEDQAFAARFAKLGVGVNLLLAAEDIAFRASPGGPVVYRLTRESFAYKPMVEAFDHQGDHTRVVYNGTPFIDAWVETAALEQPPTYAGWSCGGCGKLGRRHGLVVYQKRIPVVVVTETTLHLAPHGERVVATLAIGTQLIGREDADGWMRVELRNRELIPAEGESFWVRASDLQRIRLRRH